MTIIENPKPDTLFAIYNHRFSLFNKKVNQDEYWKSYWDRKTYLKKILNQGKTGNLWEFDRLIRKYVNKEYLTLEAGCGPGQFVAALSSLGYNVIGVDNENNVVEFANNNIPNERIYHGDVRKTNLSNNSLGAYLSFGVVEHFIEGPEQVLLEAHRLLRHDGIALISVPYLNPLRKKHRDKLAKSSNVIPNGYNFHQYYFSIHDFSKILLNSGFKVVDFYPYAVNAFLGREHPYFKKIYNSKNLHNKVKRIFRKFNGNSPKIWRKRFGHMILFVCKPV